MLPQRKRADVVDGQGHYHHLLPFTRFIPERIRRVGTTKQSTIPSAGVVVATIVGVATIIAPFVVEAILVANGRSGRRLAFVLQPFHHSSCHTYNNKNRWNCYSSRTHYRYRLGARVMASTFSSSSAVSSQQPSLGLVDVDCNLWHVDLPSLYKVLQQQETPASFPAAAASSSPSALPIPAAAPVTDATKMSNNNNNNINTIIPECFHILQHDNVRDISAILSPSSTVSEAERGIAALRSLAKAAAAAKTTEDDTCRSSPNPSPSSSSITAFPFRIPIRTTVGVHPYHVNDPPTIEEHDDNGHKSNNKDSWLSLNEPDSGDTPVTAPQLRPKKTVQKMQQQARQLLVENADLCVAVGECGLDASDGFPSIDDQIPWFQAQIHLAQELQLPLFVHERKAFAQTMKMLAPLRRMPPSTQQHPELDQRESIPVLIHCFTGTTDECRSYIERGYYLSISGYIFRENKNADEMENHVPRCLQENLIPLDKLMIETDAPYMGFKGCRAMFAETHVRFLPPQTTPNNKSTLSVVDEENKLSSKQRKKFLSTQYPNAPSALTAVLYQVAHHINTGRQARGEEPISIQELAQCTSRNANRFFRFGLTDTI